MRCLEFGSRRSRGFLFGAVEVYNWFFLWIGVDWFGFVLSAFMFDMFEFMIYSFGLDKGWTVGPLV